MKSCTADCGVVDTDLFWKLLRQSLEWTLQWLMIWNWTALFKGTCDVISHWVLDILNKPVEINTAVVSCVCLSMSPKQSTTLAGINFQRKWGVYAEVLQTRSLSFLTGCMFQNNASKGALFLEACCQNWPRLEQGKVLCITQPKCSAMQKSPPPPTSQAFVPGKLGQMTHRRSWWFSANTNAFPGRVWSVI